MTITTKAGAAAGIAAATTTLSVFFTALTSVTTASLITVITAVLSDTRSEHVKSIQKYLAIFQKHLSNLRTALEDAFLFVFTAVWLFIAGLPYGTLLLWRWANLLYIRIRWGLLTDLVDGYDIIGTIDEPASKQVIMSLKVLQGPFDLEDIRLRCERTVSRRDERGRLVFPKFFQYLDTIGGYYCWLPAKFEMAHHVRIMDGVDPDKTLTESEVMDLLSQHANKHFATKRAPWEILIIPKFVYNKEVDSAEETSKFGMVIRIHHGMGDGFSLMKLIMRDLAGEDPEKYQPPVKDPGKPWPWWYRIFAFFYILYYSPRGFYREMSKKDSNPLHNALTKVTGEKFIVWSEQINVKWLKEIKTEMKVGMNTMLFGAVGGSLRYYILEQDQGSSKLPSEITALIPAPAPNHPNNKMTNKFAVVMYPLESKSSDPRVRCAAIDKAGKHIATSPEPHVNLFLTQLIGVAPSIFSKFFIYNTQSTVVISNLPGPDRTISIWDKPLIETMFWLPNVGHSGISVSFLSYMNTLRIGMTIDRGVIPEGLPGARRLVNLTIRELEKMASLVDIDPSGHGITETLLAETTVQRHNSEEELEELLLPDDSSPLLSNKRRKRSCRNKENFKDTDSASSSSEDFGYADEESTEEDDEFSQKYSNSEKSEQQKESLTTRNDTEFTNLLRPRKSLQET